MLPSLILIWHSLPQTMGCMGSSLPQTAGCMRGWWPSQGMPTYGPLWQLQSWKSKWRGWVTPPAVNIPPATGAPLANDALPAAGGPNPWDGRKKVPKWFHAEGKLRPHQKVPRWTPTEREQWLLMSLSTKGHPRWPHQGGATKNEPSHSAPQGRAIRWPSPKEEHPHQRRVWNATLRQMWPTGCPHQCGGMRRYHTKRLIGWDQGRRLGPSQLRGIWILSVPCQWSPTSRNSWVRRSPPWQVLRQEMTFHPHQHQPQPHHHHHMKTRALPPVTPEWIEWHARYVQMPSRWEELTSIPGHADHKEFAQRVYASFEVPKACNWAKKVENYHPQAPAHPSIRKHHFLPPKDARFGAQDIHLHRLQHTIVYIRALQYWAEEVYPQPLANLTAWQGVYRNSSEQWSHSSLSQMEMSSWPWCCPNG